MPGKPVLFKGEVYDLSLSIGGGPIFPPEGGVEPPLGIWGPTDPRPSHPIYIPVPPPPDSGLKPEHPIYIPVVPAHPIVIPIPPPDGGQPVPPLVIWGGPYDPPRPAHPIYIPVVPPDGGTEPGTPANPIYLPVSPEHPIVKPPDGETPKPPPAMVNPPTGQPGFWGVSLYYKSMVFVPFKGAGPGLPTP
jgi:hypothetical protein